MKRVPGAEVMKSGSRKVEEIGEVGEVGEVGGQLGS